MNEKQPTALTRGEEEIMQILWRLGNAVVNDIIALTEEPHPKYTADCVPPSHIHTSL